MRVLSRFGLFALLVVAGLLSLEFSAQAVAPQKSRQIFPGSPAVLTAAQVRGLSAQATERSIIVFKKQFGNLPARGATAATRANAVGTAQAGVLLELRHAHRADHDGCLVGIG